MLCPVCHSPNLDGALFCTSCGAPFAPDDSAPAAHLAPRTALRGGAFVIEELLGAGGFGLTYRARESALGREVAVKEFFPFGSTRQTGRVVPPHGASGDEWTRELGAFREEALTLARFSHPAIVRAYAVWAESGTAYFAMEFLRGQSLQKRLDGGAMPVDEALDIVESIGDALERVHDAGLLHRDIKPDNILLCPGRAVLIDFGTARAFAADKTTPMTQLLTPGYAPLEQYGRRARFGRSTDVYALAATLYHALAGSAPPSAPDRAAGVELRPLDEQNPRVSPRLARAIEAALEISVPKRPPTVGAWVESLRDAQKPLAPPAPPPPKPVPTHTAPASPQNPFPAPQNPFPAPGTAGTPFVPPPHSPPFVPPRVESSAAFPDALEIAPEARTPRWFIALLIAVPVLLLTFWGLYDPARSDLRAFDAGLRPVLSLSSGVQNSLSTLNRSTPESLRAGLQVRVVPAQQKVVGALQKMAPATDEALFSRDQLLDAETEKLQALERLANAQDENERKIALDSLRRADADKAIWRADYAFLLRGHRA